MTLIYDKLAKILREPTPHKVVTFLKNGAKEEDYQDLADYLCEDQTRMCELVAFINTAIYGLSPHLYDLLQKFHAVVAPFNERYKKMHHRAGWADPTINDDVEKTREIYRRMLDDLGGSCPGIPSIERFHEIVQHYNL